MNVARTYRDDELIAAISNRLERDQAILFIYQHYAATVSSFIVQYGGSQQDAEDIFQETVVSFMDIVLKGKYRREASVKTFLVSIARNIWFNELKKRGNAGRREKLFEASRDQKEEDTGHLLGDLEKNRQLRALVERLGEPCRKILTLFYYENLSMKEMVEQLPYQNEQVVRNKKYKCLQQLTEFIKSNPFVAQELTGKTR